MNSEWGWSGAGLGRGEPEDAKARHGAYWGRVVVDGGGGEGVLVSMAPRSMNQMAAQARVRRRASRKMRAARRARGRETPASKAGVGRGSGR